MRLRLERLDARDLPATLTANAGSVIRAVNDNVLGINLAWWDTNVNTATTRTQVAAAGLNLFRFPGGSSSDAWHFDQFPNPYWGQSLTPSFNDFIAQVNGDGMVTLNYGSGSPQEAAAFLAYCNGSVGSTASIGVGQLWNGTTWINKDWQNAGYWANLRAATPLATDDGYNFLRIGRAAPFNWTYFEIGNEIYGNWEEDHHAVPHDPATYVAFSKQFANLAANIDPTIQIGLNGSGTGGNFGSVGGNWTHEILLQCVSQNYTPNFLSDHNYMFDPGNETDVRLLKNSATNPTATGFSGPINWAGRAAAYRAMMNADLGVTRAASVKLLCTEYNSVSYSPCNQTTSLVNGLWMADALGGILKTEYEAAVAWDLRNSYDTSRYVAGLYGWRVGGDYGIIGSPNAAAPASGTYTPYPTYFALQLVSKFAAENDSVLTTASDTTDLTVYATKRADGHMRLLVINKSPTADLSAPVQLSGFTAAAGATAWRYGIPQDTAQSQSPTGASALEQLALSLTVTPLPGGGGTQFTHLFPRYSMTVIDLAPFTTPPAVQSVAIDDETGQRSRVRSLAVTFTTTVTLSPGAFEVTKAGGGPVPAFSVTTTTLNSRTVATLTFTGAGLEGGSLTDGRYTLRVVAANVHDAVNPGTAMAADATADFHRLYGDVDGNATVDVSDFNAFRTAFNLPGIGLLFDADGNGVVDIGDFNAFRTRFNMSI